MVTVDLNAAMSSFNTTGWADGRIGVFDFAVSGAIFTPRNRPRLRVRAMD